MLQMSTTVREVARNASSAEQAGRAEAALVSIGQAVATVNDMNSQIATAAEQQASVAEEVTVSIQCIAQLVQEVSRATHHSVERRRRGQGGQ